MNNKYIEIEKWQELKECGVITEVEFEIERQKILNKDNTQINNKIGIANIFFILFIVFFTISIVISIVYYYWQSTLWLDVQIYYDMATVEIITNIFIGNMILLWGATIILLIIGIVLKIKEKGGIKIVD